MSEAITREEKLLTAIATGETPDIKPITRKEKYLRYLAGVGEKPSKPVTREEMFLDKIQAGGSSGGGDTGGGDSGSSQLDAFIDGSITELSSNATSIGEYACNKRRKLTTASFPAVTNIGTYAFQGCSALTTLNFPLVTDIGVYAFSSCSQLTIVSFPLVTSIGQGTFSGCSALTTADFLLVTSISHYVFQNCSNLTTLILRSKTISTLSNINAFGNTPISTGTGYIYVPRALVDTYKSATNWSTYASQFRALEDYTVDGTITGELDETKI